MRANRVSYAVLMHDDMETHVYSTSCTSLKDARKFVTFCRGEYSPSGYFVIAKIVEERKKPRRWRLS